MKIFKEQKFLRTKKNLITIKMDDYTEALHKSLCDEAWLKNLYTDKTNLINFFERVGSKNPIKNAINFSETNKIKYLLQTKNTQILPEFAAKRIFEAGSSEQNIKMISDIYNETLYYAHRTKDLLDEYSEYTRKFFETTLVPFPDSIEDTWKPINKFKIDNLIVTLNKNTLEFNEYSAGISDYFKERKTRKLIKKLFLPPDAISEEDFTLAKRRLLNLKETSLPTISATQDPTGCKYKITIKENQTVSNDNTEYTLLGENINIYFISEISK